MSPPTRIPIAVVAHHKRHAMAMKLAAAVGAEAICWDNGVGADGNHLAAWDWLAEEDSQWCVVLEDDVIPCPNFSWQLQHATEHAPTDIVALYLGRGRPPHWQEPIARVLPTAIEARVSWLSAPAMLSCQGYAMRTELFRKGLGSLRWYLRTRRLPIDEAMTTWIADKGYTVSYALPSLVEHRDGPTLVDHWDGPRNGLTALLADDCDPSGALLPEIRTAWLFGAHTHWNRSSIPLDIPLTTEGDKHGNAPDSTHERRRQG